MVEISAARYEPVSISVNHEQSATSVTSIVKDVSGLVPSLQ